MRYLVWGISSGLFLTQVLNIWLFSLHTGSVPCLKWWICQWTGLQKWTTMRLKLSVLGRVQTIACLQRLNTMSCVVHRYGSHSAFKVGTHYRTWSGDKPLRVYCMEFREEISKILGIHCTSQGCPNVLENRNNQKILFHTLHEMFRISNQIFFSWMDSRILLTVKQISVTWNTYRIVSYDLIKLMIYSTDVAISGNCLRYHLPG